MEMTDKIKTILKEKPYLAEMLPWVISQHDGGDVGDMTAPEQALRDGLGVHLSTWYLTNTICVWIVSWTDGVTRISLPSEYRQHRTPLGELS